VIEAFAAYVERAIAAGTPLIAMTRHILGLFNGLPGARAWRRYLSENAPGFEGTPAEAGALVRTAASMVEDTDRVEAA